MVLREAGWECVDWVIWLRIGTVAGSSEHSNETSGSIKDEEFLD
jgi:hypothetical protein